MFYIIKAAKDLSEKWNIKVIHLFPFFIAKSEFLMLLTKR